MPVVPSSKVSLRICGVDMRSLLRQNGLFPLATAQARGLALAVASQAGTPPCGPAEGARGMRRHQRLLFDIGIDEIARTCLNEGRLWPRIDVDHRGSAYPSERSIQDMCPF